MNGRIALTRDTTVHAREPLLYCLAVIISPFEALDEACERIYIYTMTVESILIRTSLNENSSMNSILLSLSKTLDLCTLQHKNQYCSIQDTHTHTHTVNIYNGFSYTCEREF